MKVTNFIKKVSAVGLSALMCMSLFPSSFYASEVPSEEIASYCVTAIDKEEGQVVLVNSEGTPVETNEYTEGETVYFDVEPAEGYLLEDIQILAENDSIIESYAVTEEITAFTMPGSNVSIEGNFIAVETSESVEETEETIQEESTEGESVVQETESVSEAATEESTEEPTEDSTEVETETETEEAVDIYASDFDFSSIEGIDFSSGRLLIAGDDSIFVDRDVIVSSYDGVYILQFTDIETAKRAYGYYSDKAAMVIVDTAVYVADESDIIVDSTEEVSESVEETSEVIEESSEAAEEESAVIVEENPVDESLIMEEGDTPFDELKEALDDGVQSYDIALIDTGASDVASAYSVIGDITYDDNGHGTKMVEAIRSQNSEAKILSIKAADANGRADVSAIYAAFEYAISQNVKIINFSMSAIATSENAIILDEIEKAVSMGITVVGAAGNNAANASYFVPGKSDSAYIIGAADEEGVRLSTSNFGDTVDYNVYADSTSEAAAKFAGWISTNDIATIADVLNWGLIFECDYDPEWPEGGIIYTASDDFTIAGSSLIFPASINVNVMAYLGQSDVLIYTNDSSLSQQNSYSDSIYGAGASYTPVYCYERNNSTPQGFDYTYDTTYLTQTQQQQIAYCIAHGFSANHKDSRFDGVSDIEAQFLTQAAIAAITDGVNGASLNETVYYRNSSYGGATSSLSPQSGDGWHPISSQYQVYTNLGFFGDFQKAVDLYNEAVQNADSSYLNLIKFYNTSETNGTKYYQHVVVGYSTGATLTKSANVSTSTYPLTGALYSVYNSNGTWVGSFVTDSDGTGYVATYTTSKSEASNGSIVVQYGDGYYYSTKASKILSLGTGTYTVYEKVAPNKYNLNTAGYSFTISTSNPYVDLTSSASGIFKDTMPGAVTITKSTDANTSEYPLTGGLYSVYDQNGNWKGSFITGSKGTGYVAKYVEKESEVPSTSGTIKVKYGSGWYYADDWTTSLSLDAGTYTLQEKVAPANYALNTSSNTFTVYEGSTTSLTSSNASSLKDTLQLGYITFKKYSDASTSEYPLTGALYSVCKSGSSDWVGAFITDTDGTGYVATYTADQSVASKAAIMVAYNGAYFYTNKTSTSLSVIAGTYVISEKVAPSGYNMNSGSKTVEVKANATGSVSDIDSLLKSSVTLRKSADADVNEYHVGGALYGIYKSCSDGTEGSLKEFIGAFVTGMDGTGYVATAVGSESEVPSSDKTGTARASYGGYWYFNTDGNTSMTLDSGTYYVVEMVAPANYYRNNTVYSFKIKAGQSIALNADLSGIFKDNIKPGAVTLKKSTDANTSKYPLTGALYCIYNEDNTWISAFITDADGTGYVAKYTTDQGTASQGAIMVQYGDGYYYTDKSSTSLSLNKGTYLVSEKVAPSRYALNTNTESFTVKANATTSLSSSSNSILKDELLPGSVVITKSVDTPLGTITLQKSSSNPSVTDGNDCYSLEGAVYGIYSDEGCTNKIAEMTTDANGYASYTGLELNVYYVKEITAPKGYEVNDSVITYDLSQYRSNYNKAAVYTVYDSSNNAVGTLTCDVTTGVSNTLSLAAGMYTIKETTAAMGYDLNSDSYTFEIIADNKTSITVNDTAILSDCQTKRPEEKGKAYDTPGSDPLSISIEKKDSESSISLAGAQFTIEYWDNTSKETSESPIRTWIVETNEDGVVRLTGKDQTLRVGTLISGELYNTENGLITWPIGTYRVKETKAPEGYLLSGEWTTAQGETVDIVNEGYTFMITQESSKTSVVGPVEFAKGDDVIKGSFILTKEDSVTGSEVQGNAKNLAATFELINNSDKAVFINGTFYEKGQVIMTFQTDEKGNYKSEEHMLPYGSYIVNEIEAPEGYTLKGTTSASFTITTDGQIADLTGKFQDEIIRGGFDFAKFDAETGEQIPQGGATLAGATFDVINKSEHSVFVGETLYNVDDVVFTFQTEEDGSFTSENTLLPYGTYWIVETESPEGYQLEGVLVCRFTISEDGEIVESLGDILDEVIRGGVEVVKYDAEYDKSESMYSASLDGIEFEIVNANENSVVVRNAEILSEASDENAGTKTVEPGEVVGKLIVHYDEETGSYRASTQAEDLPYGTYTIKEVAGGEGYVLTDGAERTFKIENMSEIVSTDVEGQDLIFRNQVARGNFRFYKVNDKEEPIARCLFEVENVLSGEIHYIITDENGVFNSSDRPTDEDGNYIVNANDAFVTKNADGSYTISEADLQYTTVYFSEGEFGSTAEFNAENGAFTYGTYIFREIRTSVNEGLNLINFSGTIYDSSKYLNSEAVVELGQKSDRAININTEAVDGDDGDKTLEYHLREENVTIIDKVTYSGLEEGENVILEGFIWDKTNSRLLTDAEGQLITVSMPFTAHPGEDGTGTVEMTFTFDKELVKDTSHLVAFQVLYDEHHVLILNHMDDKDEDQTVLVKHAHYVMEKERVTEAPAKILMENAEASEYGFRIGDTVTYAVTITNDGDVDLDMNVSDAFDEEIAECFTDLKISDIKNAEELQRVSDVETRIYIKAGETAYVYYTAVVSDKANEFLSKNTVDDGLGYHNVATTTNVTEHGGEEPILPDEEDDANTPVQLVPHYTMNKVRVTDAPIKSGTNQYGFYRGDTVTYAVTIENDGELPLTMDVSDAFESSIAAYFVNLRIDKVDGQENQRINDTTTNISIPVGEKVVVYYTAVVANNAPEYLAPTTADDKENDKDGYLNTATTTNVTAKYKNAEGNEVVLTKENTDALKDMSDTANTPVQVPEVVTGDTMNGTPWMMAGLAMLAIGAAAVVVLRKRSFNNK